MIHGHTTYMYVGDVGKLYATQRSGIGFFIKCLMSMPLSDSLNSYPQYD